MNTPTFRFRRENASDHRALYVIIPVCRIGIVAKVATDGTPWTFEGSRYFFRHSGGWTRVTIGKYALGVFWRVSSPNK